MKQENGWNKDKVKKMTQNRGIPQDEDQAFRSLKTTLAEKQSHLVNDTKQRNTSK